jgi:DNA primase
MTPEEEVKRLNKLIKQYETVYRTTPDPDQKERVERQLKDLTSYREKILMVNIISEQDLDDEPEREDALAAAPLLKGLLAKNSTLPPMEAVTPFAPRDTAPTAAQEEMFHLALYVYHFEREFLPFLTEKQLKLDFKFSLDRDAFYNSFQAIRRKISAYHDENRRIADGLVSRDMELEIRKRTMKLTRLIQAEAARFFRAVQRFSGELIEDAHGDMVKCLNCNGVISFDAIEGTRLLQGRTVGGALGDLREFASEAVTYLNIPEIEGQESESADRH